MPESFRSIADIIDKEPGLEKLRKIIKQSDVILEFYRIFPNLKKLVKAVKVEKSTLYLKVENSVLRSELKFNDVMIVSSINKYFKDDIIKGIRFI